MPSTSVRTKAYPVVLELRKYVGRVRRELALQFVAIVRELSPVDTGHSRNNWIPKMGTPHTGVDGSRAHPSSQAQDRGIAEISAEPQESNRVANVSNWVDYVAHLIQGSSRKAPAGYERQAVAQAKVNTRARMGRLRRAK